MGLSFQISFFVFYGLTMLSSCVPQDRDCVTCESPNPITEGYVECYNYTIRKDVYIKSKKVEVCRQPCSDENWITDCGRQLGIDLRTRLAEDYSIFCPFAELICPKPAPTCEMKTKYETLCNRTCEVGSLVYRKCWNEEERTFLLEMPPPNISGKVVCFGNIKPNPGNELSAFPISSSLASDDVFVLRFPKCKTRDIFALQQQRLSTSSVQVLFLRQNCTSDEDGVKILFVQSSQNEVFAQVIPKSGQTLSVNNCSNGQLQNDCQSGRMAPMCKCKEVQIEQLCSDVSLAKNKYYQHYLSIFDEIPWNGTYGYNGYKGCVGAEFFRCHGFPANLTEEECETFTLGMTRAEAEVFLVEGDSLWRLSSNPNEFSSYCMEDEKANNIRAQSLIQLEQMMHNPSRSTIEACCKYGMNRILMDAACDLAPTPTLSSTMVPPSTSVPS